ncbi:MAG: hypothetical protein WAM74_03500 [Xanthobacteraceae bacterium]
MYAVIADKPTARITTPATDEALKRRNGAVNCAKIPIASLNITRTPKDLIAAKPEVNYAVTAGWASRNCIRKAAEKAKTY